MHIVLLVVIVKNGTRILLNLEIGVEYNGATYLFTWGSRRRIDALTKDISANLKNGTINGIVFKVPLNREEQVDYFFNTRMSELTSLNVRFEPKTLIRQPRQG